MAYQGGRRYGDNDRIRSDWDRGSDRYRMLRGHRYGARGPVSGPDFQHFPEGYDPDIRGFLDRAGDEIRSWFGDHDAELRREYDEYYNRPYGDPRDESSRIGFASASSSNRYLPNSGYAPFTGERSGYGSEDHGSTIRAYGPVHDYGGHHDANYYLWRQDRIAELDRDYAEYQRENRERFNREFGDWRSRRGEQRRAMVQVREHMEVVGSDGLHVGTVDAMREDRIILTKNDPEAGGLHHSVPSFWIKSVDARQVTLEKTAAEAHAAWYVESGQHAWSGARRRGDAGWGMEDRASSPPDEKGRPH